MTCLCQLSTIGERLKNRRNLCFRGPVYMLAALAAVLTAALWAPAAANSTDGTGVDGLPATLRFAFVTSFGAAHNTSGVVPAVDYALERINADQHLLPDHTLQYYGPWDSGVRTRDRITQSDDIPAVAAPHRMHGEYKYRECKRV